MKIEPQFCTLDREFFRDYICLICTSIVDDPVCCSKCENLYCRDCVLFNYDICNKCQGPLKEATIGRILKNHLANLEFRCPLKCNMIIKYDQKEHHFSQCKYRNKIEPKCSLCRLGYNSTFENHLKVCDLLASECPFCKIPMSKMELKKHFNECEKLDKHCETCNTTVPCKYSKAHSEFFCKIISNIKDRIKNMIEAI